MKKMNENKMQRDKEISTIEKIIEREARNI